MTMEQNGNEGGKGKKAVWVLDSVGGQSAPHKSKLSGLFLSSCSNQKFIMIASDWQYTGRLYYTHLVSNSDQLHTSYPSSVPLKYHTSPSSN